MKKGHLILICLIVWYVCFYAISELLKNIIGGNTLITFALFFIPTFVVIVLYYFVKHYFVTRNAKVKECSLKYQEVLNINKKYSFRNIKKEIELEENEFSLKSFNDILAKQVVLYRIENNDDNIREWIEDAILNEGIYQHYKQEIKMLKPVTDNQLIKKTGLKEEKFNKIENELVESIIYDENVYAIRAHVVVNYCNKNYDILNKKDRYVKFDELKSIYYEWKNSKKYSETTKKERKLMNYTLREEVLKRDGYKCCVCGKTEKDGVRLEIDHIIPVSKGGQSTISNLQTLCNSCNAKKNTMSNDEFIKKIIKEKLIAFRKKRSKELDIPAYYIFTNVELEKIIEIMPKNIDELRESGVLPNIKLSKHGELIIKIINENN